MFIVFWIGWIFVGYYGLSTGNPSVLAIPFDIEGNACGVDPGFENHKFIYFATPYVDYINRTVCVKECPYLVGSETEPE